ncbi:hypothetical protein GUJ93_ZPchr0014g47577 [Zizania palustris]|uniref:peptidylprolyl isomerase n=1 Tax=Zizania palustris TaxID=103762 RepID=A0A8J5W6S9_ZIZPA|nr:hypothetical protein GUJ93_ZPchr0014g47577 [Zizania palustris]
MSSFWGAEVQPGKPYTHAHSARRGRLRLTQATLGGEPGKLEKGGSGKKSVVQLQCSVKNKDPVFLCALVPGQSETCHLELEFEEKYVTFSVLGPRSVHLAGYYIGDVYGEEIDDSDTDSDSLQGSDDDAFLDTDDDASGSDDDTIFPLVSPGEMSSVVIEEIEEDDKPAAGGGKKGSNKKQTSENGDDSKHLLAVRAPSGESLDSEDEDGFPVSFSESKKSTEGSSKKKGNLNDNTSTEDRKRKSSAVSDHHDLSGEVKAESAMPKKIERPRPKGPLWIKNKNKKSLEAGVHQNADKANPIHNDAEEVTAQEANKKKRKKKKTQKENTNENQTPTDLVESESKKQPLQSRTFGNGMIIQEIAMGKPDGKKAFPGKKVSVQYIGKLENGTIFDSTVGRRAFDFRLGVGEVIKGWDVGIKGFTQHIIVEQRMFCTPDGWFSYKLSCVLFVGMRVGDKRRLTIPPSMGYGSQRVGRIPQNSTLVFDVELVNVK